MKKKIYEISIVVLDPEFTLTVDENGGITISDVKDGWGEPVMDWSISIDEIKAEKA